MLPPGAAPLEALSALAECPTAAALTDAVDRLVQPIGIRHWLYALDLPLVNDRREQFTLGSYPEAWVEHYLGNDYIRIDPVVAHCHDHAVPLDWSSLLRATRSPVDPRSRSIRQMFCEAAEFGLGAGLSIPLHGPGSNWGLMSFTGEAGLAPRLSSRMAELHLLAHFVHEAARRFTHSPNASQRPPQVPRLTGRERESLYWASAGKTSWEIGQLLGISERTVIFHVQNASQKLGVSGRQAAVARAVSMGLIGAH
ncbi:helix-turn-helix transcriptional regulator [Marilutibacter aestuarii]|uniref:HTH luxR-type domain-containing protein n=1 Tax=Marilutibacter aestuarii TaxID=1706195 RepID=A0A507ZRC9_9GAMM|nr:LuxR family transcriptional regulator [Lysobacter aestuarii]TQD39547.1 hypothetical protein FKV25_15415 [Lysobacter aestuarii]